MSDKDVMQKATAVRSSFDELKSLEVIAKNYPEFEGVSPSSVLISQLGDEVRASITFNHKNQVNRFLVAKHSESSYKII